MAKAKLHKCRWSHCPYTDREIDPADEVKVGNTYYHRECLKQKSTIEKILDVWGAEINPNVVYTQLRGIVNQLVFKRGFDAEYVLYCVRVGAKAGWLHYPQGLFQTCGDLERQKEWKRMEAKKYLAKEEENKDSEIIPEQQTVQYKYRPTKERSIASIFG